MDLSNIKADTELKCECGANEFIPVLKLSQGELMEGITFLKQSIVRYDCLRCWRVYDKEFKILKSSQNDV